LCLVQVFECLAEAGCPAGVANLVIGPAQEIADEFLENPVVRKISFTGSTEVGKQLMRAAADGMKRLSLELGGHAPFIVFPDADPEVGAKIAVTGKFRNNGQVCIAPSRFYVHKDVQKKFTEATVEFAKALKLGNGLDAGVEVGPMFEKKALQSTQELIDDAKKTGARLLTGGKKSDRFDRGYFFEPTVLTDVPTSAKLMVEEPFAPVMPILDFKDLDSVIAAANATRYGLAAYVFTNDLTTAWKMAEGIEAGIIGINDPVPATPQCPFGGMRGSVIATVKRTGQVTRIAATATKPGGELQAGGYDPLTNTLHLSSGRAGHPRGMAATGGDPSAPDAAGVTVFEHEDGRIFWANDSFSLPRKLTPAEVAAV
jgi:succinate-semialdehyde dehydrogenase/glutarate-semialdehyde dehydrogenase